MIASFLLLLASVELRRRPPRGGALLWSLAMIGSALIGLLVVRPALSTLGTVTSTYVGVGGCLGLVSLLAAGLARRRSLPVAITSRSGLLETWRRFRQHRLAVGSLLVLSVLVETALLAGLLSVVLGVSHEETALGLRYGDMEWPHLLGTDDLGRDVFSRLLHGGQISLAVGVVSAFSSAVLGSTVGLFAGWYGGRIDGLLMRFTDAMLGVPVLPLMIVLSAIDLSILFKGGLSATHGIAVLFGGSILVVALGRHGGKDLLTIPPKNWPSMLAVAVTIGVYFIFWEAMGSAGVLEGNLASVIKIILIITLFGWMTVARLARAAALQVKELEFVTAARALGASDARIILLHVLPAAMAPIVVAATLEVGGNILYEAALSFLGLGIQPPVPSWGNMLNNALDYIKREPLLAFWPGWLILICVTCFNFIGDGLRDALDPHQVMKT